MHYSRDARDSIADTLRCARATSLILGWLVYVYDARSAAFADTISRRRVELVKHAHLWWWHMHCACCAHSNEHTLDFTEHIRRGWCPKRCRRALKSKNTAAADSWLRETSRFQTMIGRVWHAANRLYTSTCLSSDVHISTKKTPHMAYSIYTSTRAAIIVIH